MGDANLGTLLYFTYQPIFRTCDFSNRTSNFLGARKYTLRPYYFFTKIDLQAQKVILYG